MKKTLIACVIACTPLFSSYGQTLKDIFLELPIGGMSETEKELMIDNYLNDKKGIDNGVGKQRQYLASYLPQNGYLVYTGAYEGSTALTYWNLTNGDKLIGAESGSCGGVCDSHLKFFLKTDNNITKLNTQDVIPPITMADFLDVEQMKKDGITESITNDMFDFYPFIYHLPSKGKNIKVESQTHELGIPSKFKKYDLGSFIELTWNDGTFLMGKRGL